MNSVIRKLLNGSRILLDSMLRKLLLNFEEKIELVLIRKVKLFSI